MWQHSFAHHARCFSQTRVYLVHNLSSIHYTKIFINLITLLNCILMGIPWDGTGMNCYGMGWDGTEKYVSWTSLRICLRVKADFFSVRMTMV